MDAQAAGGQDHRCTITTSTIPKSHHILFLFFFCLQSYTISTSPPVGIQQLFAAIPEIVLCPCSAKESAEGNNAEQDSTDLSRYGNTTVISAGFERMESLGNSTVISNQAEGNNAKQDSTDRNHQGTTTVNSAGFNRLESLG